MHFLKRFEIPADVLKSVWHISSVNKTDLTQEQFFVALRLIAYYQVHKTNKEYS